MNRSIFHASSSSRRRITAATTVVLLFSPAVACAGVLEDLINEFQRFSNDRSPFGVTDGNPQAATAFLATDAYTHFGLRPILSTAPSDAGHFQVAVSGSGGTIETRSVSQYYVAADLYLAWRFTDNVGIAVSLPGQYRNTHSIETFVGGLNLGVPITIIPPNSAGNSWVLTPWALAASASGSRGLAQGGYIFGGGVTSSLSHRMDKLTLTLANQAGYDAGYPLVYSSEINFEQDISQVILKNGVQATYDFSDSLFADAGITYTNFLKGAYTDNYFTVFAGLGYRFGPASGVRIGYVGDADFSNDYYTFGGEVELYFTF
jgi:hypothetical protein